MKKVLTAALIVLGILCASVIHAAELHGIVTGKDGKPAAIKVVLKDAGGAQVGQPATTDKSGMYSFKDIKPGSYTVFVDEKNQWKIFVGPGETRRDLTLK